MKVYILSTHHDYGAENVSATTDPDKLKAMIEPYFSERHESIRIEAEAKLEAALATEDWSDLDFADDESIQLEDGWGGLSLIVVELDAARTEIKR